MTVSMTATMTMTYTPIFSSFLLNIAEISRESRIQLRVVYTNPFLTNLYKPRDHLSGACKCIFVCYTKNRK